jgi:hypothetical protein
VDKVFIFGKVKLVWCNLQYFALYFGGLLVKSQEISVGFKAREVNTCQSNLYLRTVASSGLQKIVIYTLISLKFFSRLCYINIYTCFP